MLALLSDPARWCRGGGARDATGRPCSPTSPKAVAWSMEGAIDRAAGQDRAIGDLIEDQLSGLLPDMTGPAAFNDDPGTAHADVLTCWRCCAGRSLAPRSSPERRQGVPIASKRNHCQKAAARIVQPMPGFGCASQDKISNLIKRRYELRG
ncbi:DUF6197 family protein [Methylobacterium terrae]|uniref:DUF6197 family protein n=1 Tax=Methylobacterium terrae TaxID=2202827 RepID=UPI003CC97C5E